LKDKRAARGPEVYPAWAKSCPYLGQESIIFSIMGRRTIPWDQVKQEYTCGSVNEQGQRVWPTLNELAKKYRISYSTLWKRKTSERWDDLKEQNRITIEQESNKKYIEKVADAQAEVNTIGLRGARQIIDEVLAGLERYRQQVARIFADEALDTAERTRHLKEASQALKNYAQAFAVAYDKARLAVGEPSEITEEQMTLERLIRETLVYIEMEERQKNGHHGGGQGAGDNALEERPALGPGPCV
jgi:hypothetical protein